MASILHSPTSREPSPEPLQQGSRATVWLVIGLMTVAAWIYLAAMTWGMSNMDVSADWLLMPRMVGWEADDLAMVFLMWTVMMAGMMLPSVLPLLLMLRRVDQAAADGRRVWLWTFRFVAGYLAVWTVFSLAATLAQWGLLELRLVSPMMESSSTAFSGILLILAGAYQFSPLKNACLHHCRSPLGFLLTHKIENRFRLGWRHGSYCAGCCWMIMVLLFVFGVMNLVWIFALTGVVFLEKFWRKAQWFPYVMGVGFVFLGVALLLGGPAVW